MVDFHAPMLASIANTCYLAQASPSFNGALFTVRVVASPGDHSRIFFAQYMRHHPCMRPVAIISFCAAFQSLSWVSAFSSCARVYLQTMTAKRTAE